MNHGIFCLVYGLCEYIIEFRVYLIPHYPHIDYIAEKDPLQLGKPSFKKKSDFMKNFHKMVTPLPPVLYL